ncbi:AbfB domain-containing protein [Streptomyces sp. NPDC088560]|uniref:AbfB domain-containing protein n=1 Tax=Streptomyces sp. NPDC088560 TaxID=3365868 RepID=UPI00381C1AD8
MGGRRSRGAPRWSWPDARHASHPGRRSFPVSPTRAATRSWTPRKDATFCARSGSADGSLSLESYNCPGRHLRHRDNPELRLDPSESSAAYRAGRSFAVVAPRT